MDLMQQAGSGPLVRKSPIGELTQASHLHHQDGISGSNPKVYRFVLMWKVSCMALQLLQIAEKVEAGYEGTIALITTIMCQMVLARILAVPLKYLPDSSGLLQLFRKLM